MSKKNIYLLIAIIVMFGIFNGLSGSSASSVDLQSVIKNGAKLVDVRSTMEFNAGSVPNAINIPLDKIAVEYERLEKEDTIVVFCASGNRSGQAKSFLEQKGFINVINGGSWTNVNSSL